MTPAIYTEKLADVRYITAKLERLPEKTPEQGESVCL